MAFGSKARNAPPNREQVKGAVRTSTFYAAKRPLLTRSYCNSDAHLERLHCTVLRPIYKRRKQCGRASNPNEGEGQNVAQFDKPADGK
jgi:hypothetical protein